MRRFWRVCTGVSLALLSATQLFAAHAQSFDGSTAGQPFFERPDESGASLSGVLVRYQAQGFRLQEGGLCNIYSMQEHDGFLHLYRGDFDPQAPLVNLIAWNDDGDFQRSSELRFLALEPGTYTLVTSGYSIMDAGKFQTNIHCGDEFLPGAQVFGDAQPLQGSCDSYLAAPPIERQTCLHDRFAMGITGISNHPSDGIATPVRFGSRDSSFFWFYAPNNYELLAKVLDGCAINDRYWVFVAAVTNQAYTVRVRDAATGLVRTYANPLGTRAAAVTDTDAFDCTP
jgi:hypothetical protein